MSTTDAAGRNRSSVHGSDITLGTWTTEVASAAALDRALATADLWKVYSEVEGTLIQPRHGQVDKGMRIDRILVPNKRLLDLGWQNGIVGVEIKRSGEQVGPAIAQALDYGRSVFDIPGSGFAVWLSFVFIWPTSFMGSPPAIRSICQQQHVGSAFSTNHDLLILQCGSFNILEVSREGDLRLKNPTYGRKAGSR